MRAAVFLAVLVLLSGCGGPRSEPLETEPSVAPDAGPAQARQATPPPPQSFLNDTFSLEVFAHRNAVSYTAFNNAANCVKIDGKQLVEFAGIATWTPTSEFTRNLRIALIMETVVNETVGPSPLDFTILADVERMAATARHIGVLLEGEGFAVKQPVTLELSVRSATATSPTATTLPCPSQ